MSELYSDFELVVVGDTGYPFKDPKIDFKTPRLRLLGRIIDADLPALYSGATCFVYPSIYEGFGLPVLEAMACGTPVIASNTTSLPEVIGEAGLQVDPYDVNEIAAAIENIVEDKELQKDLRHRGLQQAKQFTWERTAKMTWDVLEQTRNEIIQQ